MYLTPFLTTLFLLKALQLVPTNRINLWVKVLRYLPAQSHLLVFLGFSIEFNMCMVPALFLCCNLALLKCTTTIGFKDSALWLQLLTCTYSYFYQLDAH